MTAQAAAHFRTTLQHPLRRSRCDRNSRGMFTIKAGNFEVEMSQLRPV